MMPLKWVLESAGLSQEQLVDMSIMIGTNFNPTGLYGIGPKKALKIIEKHGQLEDTPQVRSDVVRADVAQSEPNAVQTTIQGAKKRHDVYDSIR